MTEDFMPLEEPDNDKDIEQFVQEAEQVVKRKPGRPRIHPVKPRVVHEPEVISGLEIQAEMEIMAGSPRWKEKRKRGRVRSEDMINDLWSTILQAARNGYTMQEVSACLKISRKTFNDYLNKYPSRRAEMYRAKFALRDEMLEHIITAARSGKAWVAAAWTLERLFPATFAKPEVKVQMYDRLINKEIVEQKIGGKTVQEIRLELENQLKDHPDERARRLLLQPGSGNGTTGHNESVREHEEGLPGQEDS